MNDFSTGLKRFLHLALENEISQNQYEHSLAEMKARGLLRD
jgi:hypothetical protein